MSGPIIHVTPMGGIGNRMIQHLVALALQKRVPGSVVVGVDVPGWTTDGVPPPPLPARTATVRGGHEFSLDRIARLLTSGIADAVDLQTFGQRLEYLGEPEHARPLFLDHPATAAAPRIADDSLLVSVRGAETLRGVHRDYMPLPLSFYESVIGQSGLRPIFMGQLDQGDYGKALRARFPTADFWPARSPVIDFATIASAKNVVCSISSFCWLAAWMSPVARTIHLPVAGLFNPLQRMDIDLLPLRDRRYRFHLAPPEHWTGVPAQVAHWLTRTTWATPISHGDLAETIRRALR